MRTAIYARVSSERQERERTIGSQLEVLRAYAAQNQLQVIETFTDEGYSGARLDRPSLDRLRDAAERGEFEVVLALCADRLARKFVLQALIMEELEQFAVKVIFIEGGTADDPLSKLTHQITGAVAEFERNLIRERTTAGLVAARARGRKGGRPRSLSEKDLAVAEAMLAKPEITVAEVAERLGTSPATLYRYLPKGGRSALLDEAGG